MKSLDEANLLHKEIKELESFIYALDVTDLWREKSNVTAVITKTVKTTYSIFGRRFFGCGAHEKTIDVPTSTIPALVQLAKGILQDKQSQLNNLIK